MRLHMLLFLVFALLAGAHCAPSTPAIWFNRAGGSTLELRPGYVERWMSAAADISGHDFVLERLRDEGFDLASFEWDSSRFVGKPWAEVLGTEAEVTNARLYWVFGRPVVVGCSTGVEYFGKWVARKASFTSKPDEFWWELVQVPSTTRSAVEREFSFRSEDGAAHAEIHYPGLLIADATVREPDGEERRVSVPLTIELASGTQPCD